MPHPESSMRLSTRSLFSAAAMVELTKTEPGHGMDQIGNSFLRSEFRKRAKALVWSTTLRSVAPFSLVDKTMRCRSAIRGNYSHCKVSSVLAKTKCQLCGASLE